MIQWKQRLYAFLLRRVLGPFLTEESLAQLHNCIDVSFQEGKFTLQTVCLNLDRLSQETNGLRFLKARVERLEVILALIEHGSETVEDGMAAGSCGGSSFAWKAMQLTSTSATASKVSLQASITIDGLHIELAPCDYSPEIESTASTVCSTAAADEGLHGVSSCSSLLSSYLEAALASLRLSLQLQNVQVRVWDSAVNRTSWLEVRLKAASYHDMDVRPVGRNETSTGASTTGTSYETVLSKVVEFARITILVGSVSENSSNTDQRKEDRDNSSSSTVAMLDGSTSQIVIRAIEYKDAAQSSQQQQEQQQPKRKVQNDIQVSLNQRLNVSVDATSLREIQQILRGFQNRKVVSSFEGPREEDSRAVRKKQELQVMDQDLESMEQADLRTVDGIMKQYYKARVLAEQNHFRGGILLPSEENNLDPDNDDTVTFDAFFDANDQSIGHYSVILKESVIARDVKDVACREFVHTKFRFHLVEGLVKVVFADKDQNHHSRRRADEYLLLSFSELTVNSSLSIAASEHCLSIAHIDVDDSQLEVGQSATAPSKGKRVDIGSVLKFSPGYGSTGVFYKSDVLLAPPCASVTMRTKSSSTAMMDCEIELALEPVEVTYRNRTVANLIELIESLEQPSCESESQHDEATAHRGSQYRLSVSATCPSVTLTAPVLAERDWGQLYIRRGYMQDEWIVRSSIRLCLSGISIQASGKDEEPAVCVAFHSAVLYALAPIHSSTADRSAQRFDIMCLSGRSEVDPVIEITFKLWKVDDLSASDKSVTSTENHGTRLFPKVPAISSFKARQEDEDDEKRVDRVLSSHVNELNFGNTKRSQLRVNDPQADMMLAASASSSVLEIRLPEVIFDISCEELLVLSNMLEFLFPRKDSNYKSSTSAECKPSISIALTCDLVLLELRDAAIPERTQSSFVVQLDKFQLHLIQQGSSIRQMRVLSHDMTFLEVLSPCEDNSFKPSIPCGSIRDRFRTRFETVPGSKLSIVLHRTSLFPTISSQSPAILFDMIDHSTGLEQACDPLQRNVYMTLYDLTYRYDHDKKSIERLQALVEKLNSEKVSYSGPMESDGSFLPAEPDDTFQVTRLFFFITDCNLDYSSSLNFVTPSRTVLRVADFRVSSNIVFPKPALQAFSVSLGDVALYISKTRFPYNFENSHVNVLSLLGCPAADVDLGFLGISGEVTPESVQKAMRLVTIALLDSLDAVVTIANTPARPQKSQVGLNTRADEPYVQANLTVGELGIFAAKDSFSTLMSTLAELAEDITALDACALRELRTKTFTNFDEGDCQDDASSDSTDATFHTLDDLKRQSTLRPTPGTSGYDEVNDFLLDGYDWTTIDQDESAACGIPPGEEQVARWYSNHQSVEAEEDRVPKEDELVVAFLPTFNSLAESSKEKNGPRLNPHHFPCHPVSDPLSDTDMDLSKFVGSATHPQVRTRILVHDLSFKIRCFDGFDWPDLLDENCRRALGKGAFVLDEESKPPVALHDDNAPSHKDSKLGPAQPNRRSQLMGELLETTETTNTFRDLPLPEERGAHLREQAALQRLMRRPSKYFQFSGSGVSFRFDSLDDSIEHRLASCLSVKAQDVFIAETISSDRPVKFAGEWVNEVEHPRDSKVGLMTMKMVTWHPLTRVTSNNEIVNDEAEAVLHILPLRCAIDQRAVRFARCFFGRSDDSAGDHLNLKKPAAETSRKVYAVPPPLFRSFRFKPFKLKVDYRPEKLDAQAIYNGALVELINLSPLDGLVLTLQQVRGHNVVGFGEVMSYAVSHWLRDVCATQLLKFVTSARPLEPISNVSCTALDLFVLPWEAIQNGESVQRALRTSTSAFSSAILTETLTMTSRLTQFVADQVARMSSPSAGMNVLPSRPLGAPRDFLDTTPHVMESLTRGLQAANYKIIIIPYREYRRRGAKGAVTSVLKGIPVAIAAPTSGAAEAISFAALGVRNQVRPDLRKEEEAALRGLHWDG